MLTYCSVYTEFKVKEILDELAKIQTNNIFSGVFDLIRLSTYHYGLNLIDGETEICNLNIKWDERLNNIPKYANEKKKPSYLLPPNDFDGYLALGMFNRYVDRDTRTKKVNIKCILFHELLELYCMLDKDDQYKEAHEYSREKEIFDLLVQFPGLTEFPAGDWITRETQQ